MSCIASLSLVKVGPQDIERFKTSYQSNECYFSNETNKFIVTVVRNVYEITLRDTYPVVWVCLRKRPIGFSSKTILTNVMMRCLILINIF